MSPTDPATLQILFRDLTTPHVADACMRLDLAIRHAPPQVRPLWEGIHLAGHVLPVRHRGSVDAFLDAIDDARPGDVLLVDNQGRDDEACVGDLIALEARDAGLAGIVIWGRHRDTAELHTIRLPLFSTGALPVGPQDLDRAGGPDAGTADVGLHRVSGQDVVLADDDGVLFLPAEHVEGIAATATAIRDTERRQAARAARAAAGESLREQTDFGAYRRAREHDPDLTFREHLRARAAEIEQ